MYPRRSSYRLPTLLRVCRQIREDARSIYYSKRTFIFHTNPRQNVVAWLKTLESKDVAAINDILTIPDIQHQASGGWRFLDEVYRCFERAQLKVADEVVKAKEIAEDDKLHRSCCKSGRCYKYLTMSNNRVVHWGNRQQLRALVEEETGRLRRARFRR